jgi:hypothetical protein
MLLAEVEEQRVRCRRKDMRDGVDVVSLERVQMVGYEFGERGRTPSGTLAPHK